MLKRWRVAFDPDTDYFPQRHLWVLFPGLHVHLWNEGALKAIGDALGTFIALDYQSLKAQSRKVGKILVEVDIHCGLPEVLEVEWHGRRLIQRLDYMGIPFSCSLCRCTRHIRWDYKDRWLLRMRMSFKMFGMCWIAPLLWMFFVLETCITCQVWTTNMSHWILFQVI
jgi:hypothetical protein